MVHNKHPISATMPDFTGHVIDNGRLQLLDSLGSGAFGKVYRAVDTTTPKADRKYYAVKCLVKPKPGTREDRFQKREIAIQQLVHTHPNIATLHKVICDDLFTYVVLDLCMGGDLFAAISESKMFYMNDLLIKHTFIQIIDAMHYCHQRSVFHRDIKPENILFSEDKMHISLSDFGLSTIEPVCSDFGCGSSCYMSPECIEKQFTSGKYSTCHNDIWSLGVMLVNMITGHNPWPKATIKDGSFAAYLHDNNFIQQTLPISNGANAILKSIFKLNPLSRISLPELRNEILSLDTFFLPEEGIPITAIKTPVHHNAGTMNINLSLNSPFNSEEHYYFRSPQVDEEIFLEVVSPSPCRTPVLVADSGTVNSGQESEGPITPPSAIKAVDPETEVSDLGEMVTGFSSMNINAAAETVGTQKSLPKHQKPFTKHIHLFQQVINKLTGAQ